MEPPRKNKNTQGEERKVQMHQELGMYGEKVEVDEYIVT